MGVWSNVRTIDDRIAKFEKPFKRRFLDMTLCDVTHHVRTSPLLMEPPPLELRELIVQR